MENQFSNFNRIIEKKYLPNGEKDKAVGTEVIFNILDKKIDVEKCESIFLKSLAILALNDELTIQRLEQHLTFSKSIDLFTEIQLGNFHIFLKKIQELAMQGKGASQIIERSPDKFEVAQIPVSTNVQQVSNLPKIAIAVIIIVVLLIISMFYWYQIRPSNIRKDCYSEVDSSSALKNTSKERFEFLYKACLTKYGIIK